MPGICGIVRHTPGPIEPLLGAMCHRLSHYPWHQASSHSASDGSVGLGAVLLDHTARGTGLSSEFSLYCAFEGDLHDLAEPRAQLVRQGVRMDDDSIVALLLRGVWLEGTRFFERLNGSFAAALWNEERKHLSLVNDRFGLRPIFYVHGHGRLIFASEIGALLQDATISRKLSAGGLGQFLAFGQFLGDTTLFDDIRLLPPGSVLDYDAAADRVTVSSYITAQEQAPSTMSREEALDAVAGRFLRAVERRTTDSAAGPFGLSLSGGLDARTILAAVPAHVQLTTVSLGMPGSMDHDAAAVLSALVNRRHHQHMLDQAFLTTFEENLRQMVRLTSGHYLDQGIVMTTLPLYRELGIKTLLRGHAGELLHMRKAYAFSLDAAGETVDSAQSLKSWLLSHLTNYMIGDVDGPLLSSQLGTDVREVAANTIETALAPLETVQPPLQRLWHLFIRERLRRETGASLHMFRNFVEVRVPYMDTDLIDLILTLPPAIKLDATLQSHILKRIRPEFLRVTNANTGTRMDASPLRARIGYLRMKVMAKLGAPGYQPYERLGLWLTTDLKPLLQRTILSEPFLARGIVDVDHIRRLVAQHESRERNHTYLLMALIILELAHQEVFEPT